MTRRWPGGWASASRAERAFALALLGAAALLAFPAASLGAPQAPRPQPARPQPQRPAPRWRAPSPRAHRDAVARWHAVSPGQAAPRDDAGRPMLVLVGLNTGEKVALRAGGDDGGFEADALEQASTLLRDPRTGLGHPVDPRALDLVYRAQVKFGAPEIRVISGYRAPGPRGASQHGRGRAIDLVVPGAADQKVVEWAKGTGFAGVGLYPNAGYVHLDVRAQSYFWVDASGPGQRNREVAVGGAQARKADEQARRRGERPVGAFVLPSGSIDGALGGQSGQSGQSGPSGQSGQAAPAGGKAGEAGPAGEDDAGD